MQIIRYLKRIKELGPLGAWQRIAHRANKKLFTLRWKRKAIARQANHAWEKITQKHRLNQDFRLFFDACKKNNFCVRKNLSQPNKHAIFNKRPWPQKNNLFYQDIRPSSATKLELNQYAPDIKEPWEQSRFQHEFDHKDISLWIDKNKFLIGVNWVCPMEAAIRAINWIAWFEKNKNSRGIEEQFWKKFICSLYDHAYYLKHNWETSDRPNNHYIADLVGYFYLCCFFEQVKYFARAKKIIFKKILEQFAHQVQDDGTSYEGSSSYHKLVTELFALFAQACKTTQTDLPEAFYEKLDRMARFIELCTINEQEFVQIGDNDSGVIISGGTRGEQNAGKRDSGLSHYPNFGLTIIKKQSWHITFRHPTYQSNQPTGHFHRDELSITLAYKSIPVLVDPGSYVYTSNQTWRNLMRSYQSHNTFYHETEQVINPKISRDLFQLPKQIQQDTTKIVTKPECVCVQNSFQNRIREIRLEKNRFCVNDKYETSKKFVWSLLFHPAITVTKIKPHKWVLSLKQKKLLVFTSSLNFSETNGFYSPQYGVMQPTVKLIAQQAIKDLAAQQRFSIIPVSTN
ncbi:heparinase II/III family protein [Candidatus Dependentiae bacterium]|nr:heparinase II/III family protein [Candidatus Dependentiae bacterium]